MRPFILNTDDLDLFVARESARLDEDGQAWALRHARRFFLADPRCHLPIRRAPEGDGRADLRRNLATARRFGLAPVWFDPPPEVEEEFRRILDWIGALPEIDPKLGVKRPRITYVHAREHARRWHDRLAKSNDPGFEDDPEGTETFIDLGNGLRWVRLASRRALDYEGARMRHCVGDGAYDRFSTEIFSLRDGANRPHCTVEFDPSRRRIQQAKGLANEDVPPKYLDDVERLLERLKPLRINSRLTEFVIAENDEILRLSQAAAWPTGTAVANHLVLSNRADVHRLPDGLRVDGSLVVANCTLETLPRELSIGQALAGLSLSPITRLPEGLNVRVLNLEDSLIKEIAPGTCVRKELSLLNAALRHLPEGICVGQLLILDGRACPRLPRDLTVAGRRVSDLTRGLLPETVTVFGEVSYTDLLFEGAGHITIFGRLSFAGWEHPHFPRALTVHGTFDLKHATLDETADLGRVTVHGDLDLRGTEVGRLPEDWTVHGRVLRD